MTTRTTEKYSCKIISSQEYFGLMAYSLSQNTNTRLSLVQNVKDGDETLSCFISISSRVQHVVLSHFTRSPIFNVVRRLDIKFFYFVQLCNFSKSFIERDFIFCYSANPKRKMDLVCRFCGSATSDLVQRFDEGSKNWTIFVAKVRCSVKFDLDPALPQMVCRNCVDTIKTFDKYCKIVKCNQKYLKKATVVKPKKATEAPCIDNISLAPLDIPAKFETCERNDAVHYLPLRLPLESNESLRDHNYGLREKNISRKRESPRKGHTSSYPEAFAKFSIDIVRLPIDHVETDPESDWERDKDDDDDELKDFNFGRLIKRPLEPSSDLNCSSGKRLKLEHATVERYAVVRNYKIKFTPKAH